MSYLAYLLNLADLTLTLHALNHGGVELNPLMQSVPVMVLYKVVVVGILCWVLQILAYDKRSPVRAMILARKGLRIVTTVYAVLFLYHLFFIFIR